MEPLGVADVEEPFEFDPVDEDAAAAGNAPAAWVSAALISSELMRTSLAPASAVFGCPSCSSFFCNDSALAAAAAGAIGAATGAGRRSTSTSVRIDIAKVA